MVTSLRDTFKNLFPHLSLRNGVRGIENPFYESPGTLARLINPISIYRLTRHLQWPSFSSSYDKPGEGEDSWMDDLQGVAHDDESWYFSIDDVDHGRNIISIPAEFDLDDIGGIDVDKWTPLKRPDSIDDWSHAGDLDFVTGYSGGMLVVPFEKEKKDETAKIGFCTSALDRWIAIEDLVGVDGPWCAVNPLNGLIYTCKFYGGPSFARWLPGDPLPPSDPVILDVYRSGLIPPHRGAPNIELVGRMPLYNEDGSPFTGWAIQGGAFSPNGHLYLSVTFPQISGSRSNVECFDMLTGRRVARLPFEVHTSRPDLSDPSSWGDLGQEPEGITYWDLDGGVANGIDGQIHLLILETSADHAIWFKHFHALPASIG